MKTGYKSMRCGLIGEHLSHSLSVPIHKELADYSYELYELAPDEVANFVKNGDLNAFNVTIPYKKKVIPYLDVISPEASAIGAVNTIVRGKDGRIYGYNTDYFGFSYMVSLSDVDVKGKKVLLLGKGGASLTVSAVLRDLGACEVNVIGSKDNTPENIARFYDAEIIVNATPVGMYPNNGSSPIDLSCFVNCKYVFDLIYNPAKTALIIEAERLGIPYVNGLPMLVAQAARAYELFTEDTIEKSEIERITAKLASSTRNIVLVGMPGCGKSTIGKAIARALCREFKDADECFFEMHGITPADCITTFGESRFRELESETVKHLGSLLGIVLATGGGVVTRECNYAPLHQNGTIFFIDRKLENLARNGRPLSLSTPLEKLYAERISAYKNFSDVIVTSDEIIQNTVNAIIDKFNTMP